MHQFRLNLPQRFVLYCMGLIIWLVCPDIKVIFGRVAHRRFYEVGDVPFPLIEK